MKHIINLSILKQTFPNQWKIGKIIPLYKAKGDKLNPNDYCPVTLLNAASKIL